MMSFPEYLEGLQLQSMHRSGEPPQGGPRGGQDRQAPQNAPPSPRKMQSKRQSTVVPNLGQMVRDATRLLAQAKSLAEDLKNLSAAQRRPGSGGRRERRASQPRPWKELP